MSTHGLRDNKGSHLAWQAVASHGTNLDRHEGRPGARASSMSKPPIWDKNNVGFWLTVCVLISLLFSVVYRALT